MNLKISRNKRITLPVAIVFGMAFSLFGLLPAASLADTVNVTATGRFVYVDESQNTVGIKHAKVRLWDTDWFFPCPLLGGCRDFMGEGETDDDGYFSISGSGTDDYCAVANPFGGCALWFRDNPDPYVEIEADSASGVVQTPGITKRTYCFKSGFRDNADGNADFGTISPASPGTYASQGNGQGCSTGQDVNGEHGAWQLFNNVRESWEFMRRYTLVTPGRDIPKVKVIWPDFLGSSLYRPPIPLLDEGSISIQGGQEFNEAVVMHEFGHHVMQHFADNPIPDYNNGHCDPVQILWFGGHCAWESEKNSVHWTEGWPDFLAEVLTTHYGKTSTFTSNACPDFNTHSPCTLESPPRSPIPDTNYRLIEGYTAAILWDQLDAVNTSEDHDGNGSRDNLSRDFAIQWDVLVNYDPDGASPSHNHPVTIDEFWTGYAVRNPELANRLSEIYHENGITDKQAADLRVTELSNPPAKVTSGRTFSVTEVTNNFGSVNTGETFQTRIYLSTDAVISNSDTYLGGRDLSLSAVASSSGSLTVRVPADMAPGTYYLGACADAEGLIFETNEGNNCLASGQITVEAAVIKESDLIVTGISTLQCFPSPCPLPGDNVSVIVTIKNQGTDGTRSLAGIGVDIYKHADSAPTAHQLGDVQCKSQNVPVGETRTCTGKVSYAAAGNYKVWAQVNISGNEIESSQSNNLYGPHTIVVSQPCVPATFYRDADGDGYGNLAVTTQACTAPAGHVADHSDCNDNDPKVNPAAAEACDLQDNNCNGQIDEGVKTHYYRDADGDGYGNANGATQACTQPAGYTASGTDCNDNVSSVHPGATELCNGVDDNCSGQTDEAGVCYMPVRTVGTSISYYPSLFDAISAAQGSAVIIQAQLAQLQGYVRFNRPVRFTLKGGYDSNYSVVSGYTTIQGTLAVSSGSLVVDHIAIK
ncbi:MAG: hypothetical protein A2075_21290 [Geobacteraceae bacterium GWC2_58_44]|nr:MAG: hypothetical protein A2075_21290 [Geobacteraceae bacterium GWC2_58_44]